MTALSFTDFCAQLEQFENNLIALMRNEDGPGNVTKVNIDVTLRPMPVRSFGETETRPVSQRAIDFWASMAKEKDIEVKPVEPPRYYKPRKAIKRKRDIFGSTYDYVDVDNLGHIYADAMGIEVNEAMALVGGAFNDN